MKEEKKIFSFCVNTCPKRIIMKSNEDGKYYEVYQKLSKKYKKHNKWIFVS